MILATIAHIIRMIIRVRLLFLILILVPFASFSQELIKKKRPLPQHMVVTNGDTVAYDILPILPVGIDAKDYWTKYYTAKVFVPKIYYYVALAEELLQKYEADLSTVETKKDRKKYIKKANKQLKQELGEDIRKMSETRGRYLIKLIHRQTQKRAFDIIAEYRGKGTAKLWQGISKVGGADLKLTYDAYGKDSHIEMVVRDIESGILAYEDHTPKTELGKDLMNKRKKKRKAKAKKIETVASK